MMRWEWGVPDSYVPRVPGGHLADERLQAIAEGEEGSRAELRHVVRCRRCGAEIGAHRGLVALVTRALGDGEPLASVDRHAGVTSRAGSVHRARRTV